MTVRPVSRSPVFRAAARAIAGWTGLSEDEAHLVACAALTPILGEISERIGEVRLRGADPDDEHWSRAPIPTLEALRDAITGGRP